MTQRPVSYHDFPYPRLTFPRTHPAHLGAIARLMAVNAAPPERCRVLELGCASGANLIPMAFGLPESQFLGVDLSAHQIAEAQRVTQDLGLRNVAFQAANLMDLGAELGTFDYVIAHGLYSWVPAPVRDKLLSLCGEVLSPHGVAYISYKTYPGGHVADMVRQMGLYHNHAAEPSEWPRRMGELVQLLRTGIPEKRTAYRAAVLDHTKRMLDESPGALLHDDLEADSEPVYFHQFAAHADRHGLQYLGEAEFPAMRGAGIEPEALERIGAGDDLLEFEQYLDFLYGRSFRATLLCRKDVPLDRALRPERIVDLYVVPEIQPESTDGPNQASGQTEVEAPTSQRYRTVYGLLEVTEPAAQLALAQLARNRSQAMSLPALLDAIHEGASGSAPIELNLGQLAEWVLDWHATGVVELCTWAPKFARQPTTRPKASELARYEAHRGWDVSSLIHRRVRLTDPLARRTLQLLDGHHNREQIVQELLPAVSSAEVNLSHDKRTLTERSDIAAALRRQIDAYLQDFARQALLIA
ncbi:MAG: class I SAM-dependent methyltransferase [Planctomycetia bacterium]|nr:class I SAM-dependent methyltransferase [Planctomycetia bacterium]